MNKIKIGYFADGPWSHNSFKLINDDNRLSIEFIVPRVDTKDKVLKEFSNRYKIDYLESIDVNSENFYLKAKSYDCDIFVSMSYNQIFKKKIIELPKLGIINCHAGKLPDYKGRNILNWCLINDEKEFGITVHFVDEKIDTGKIIKQNIYPITDKDTYKTLLNLSYNECPKILHSSIIAILENNLNLIDQNDLENKGFYCKRRVSGDEIINFNKTKREIFNFIRAICEPGPKALAFINDKEVYINSSRIVNFIKNPNRKFSIGEIVEQTKNGYIVSCKDGFIEFLEVFSKVHLNVGDIFKKFN